MVKSQIIGTGAYIPEKVVTNNDFLEYPFLKYWLTPLEVNNDVTIKNFESITGIRERRYADSSKRASDMATLAGKMAIKNAGISPEKIDYIILAHNYGDRNLESCFGDNVPSLASRVKHNLGIENPDCIPYDLIFGCPGWLQGVIQANGYLRSGEADYCLVIGADTLSRITDPHDRDTMIFSDGAGACVLVAGDSDRNAGIVTSSSRSDTGEAYDYIYTGNSYSEQKNEAARYIKMRGHKVYAYAVTHVPAAMKCCLDKSGFGIRDLKMIFMHQANEKMDTAIVKNFYELYGIQTVPDNVMPMNIRWMGNSSVATIPTLLHQVLNNEIEHFRLREGDLIMFASVGAGMNINAVLYLV